MEELTYIAFNVSDGLGYSVDKNLQLTLDAVESSHLKLTETGLWIGDLKTINSSSSEQPSDGDNTPSDETSTEEESGQYPEYGISAIGGPNPKVPSSRYMVQLCNTNAVFYSINNNVVTKWPDSKQIKKKDLNKWYTIVEETTVDGIKYAHQVNNGWWIKIPPDHGTPSDDSDLVSLKGIDNWTIVPYDSSTTIRTNFDVVQHVYTLATHRIIARSKKGVSEHTTVPKNKADVLSEINWLYYCGMQKPPTHHIRKNELMIFATYTNHQPPAWDITKSPFVDQMTKHYGESCETLDRSPSDNMKVNAVFLVEDIHYTSNRIGQFPVEDIQLRCIWTDGAIGKVGKILL